ncbi:MAG TPA: hypothetical protein VN688_33715 [Gemmataceae bacterium]|nr:hypothetical protein [Gemmataceae bacterium]
MFQISFILRKPLLGQQEFLTILRFQYGGEPTLENLDTGDYSDSDLFLDATPLFGHTRMTKEQEG